MRSALAAAAIALLAAAGCKKKQTDALPDAIEVALSVSANPDSTRRDVLQANDSVRKIVKNCIEETAKLPGAGCP